LDWNIHAGGGAASLSLSDFLLSSPYALWTYCKELPNKNHATCGKERFIGNQTAGLSLSGSELSSLAGMGSGLYRRGQAVGE
jgi:hypothetical protein